MVEVGMNHLMGWCISDFLDVHIISSFVCTLVYSTKLKGHAYAALEEQ
jgi:hypothetical protein